jgi:ABC-2 type transport system ATP-binding protein
VKVLGLDPIADAAALKPRVGVMLQAGGVYPGVKAIEMLKHVARLHRHPLPVGPLVERLGLGGAGRTPYRRLSGGQQQRLSLAMAVVGRPELVFLDEPTAGLDPQARRATWELVEQLRTDGVTVVLTTHYMEEAERLADNVVVVDAGTVITSGTPRELTSRDAAGSLRFGAAPGLDVQSLSDVLPEGTVVRETVPGHYLVEGPVDPRLLASVTAWCAERSVMPQDLSIDRRTLEDVFIELTGRELRT